MQSMKSGLIMSRGIVYRAWVIETGDQMGAGPCEEWSNVPRVSRYFSERWISGHIKESQLNKTGGFPYQLGNEITRKRYEVF